jgi:hypothetical protein
MASRKKQSPRIARENFTSQLVTRVKPSTLELVDEYALTEGLNRAEATRALVQIGLRAWERTRAKAAS